MQAKTIEVGVGVFVAIAIAALFMLAVKVSNIAEPAASGGYAIKARFENVGGLKVRSPVKMSGVLIGRVAGISFDSETYEAVVTMDILPEFDRLPLDTTASIFTAGLVGKQYIGLEAGGEDTFLGDEDEILLTQSAIVLEQVIAQFLFNKAAE